MEFRKFGDTYTVRMDRGEEILSTLAAFCEREDIRLAQVDALGAVDRASVAVYDVGTKTFYRRVFTEPMEITNLCGTVSRMDGRPYLHLHVTLADRELCCHGGHAVELTVAATCEMTVRVLPGEVGRRYDEATGLNLFSFGA